MIIFTTYFIDQPDVTCGHFWKGSFGGDYKIYIFLWEARLLSMIRKTTVEIVFTSYLLSSAKMDITFPFLWKYNLSNPLFFFLFLHSGPIYVVSAKMIKLMEETLILVSLCTRSTNWFFPKTDLVFLDLT